MILPFIQSIGHFSHATRLSKSLLRLGTKKRTSISAYGNGTGNALAIRSVATLSANTSPAHRLKD